MTGMCRLVVRYRYLLLASLLLRVGAAPLALYYAILPAWLRGPVWDKYQQVRLGMTEEEVEAILGPPDSVEGGELMPSCSAWFVGEQTVAVDFDTDGRATEKRFRPWRSPWWVRERKGRFP
jgi:hypothetical protein